MLLRLGSRRRAIRLLCLPGSSASDAMLRTVPAAQAAGQLRPAPTASDTGFGWFAQFLGRFRFPGLRLHALLEFRRDLRQAAHQRRGFQGVAPFQLVRRLTIRSSGLRGRTRHKPTVLGPQPLNSRARRRTALSAFYLRRYRWPARFAHCASMLVPSRSCSFGWVFGGAPFGFCSRRPPRLRMQCFGQFRLRRPLVSLGLRPRLRTLASAGLLGFSGASGFLGFGCTPCWSSAAI